MTEEQPGAEPPEKETIKRFVLRLTEPFRIETRGLGPIVARALTTGASITFAKRMASLDGVDDTQLVRTYMGCVSGLPVTDEEALPEPLTEEQVARLTHDDVLQFSRLYLEHIVKPEAIDDDPLAQMAHHIRSERQHHLELLKKSAESFRAALNIGATADLMKNWQSLTRNIAGPVEKLQDEMRRVLGPLGSMKPVMAAALRDIEEERTRTLKSLRETMGHEQVRELPRHDYTPITAGLKFPEPLPDDKTLNGRTAIAVEKLHELGQSMEGAMGLVLEQAAHVSEKMGLVLTTIEDEAAKSQQAARLALGIGVVSLLVSAAALWVSAHFSRVGYQADRNDAKAGDLAAAEMTRRIEEQTMEVARRMDQQTAVMQELLANSRKAQAAAAAAISTTVVVDRGEKKAMSQETPVAGTK